MNKILTSYNCDCGCNKLPSNLLKITAGNDFSIELQLTEKVGDEWVHYDMSDMTDVIVSVVSPNGTPTELESIINESGNLLAIVDAQKFKTYVIYGIEVLWRDDEEDKRAYAPHVFAFVNSSMEATDSAYRYTSYNPYEYNIQMVNDMALISIGRIPEIDMTDYYTREDVDEILTSYVTDDELQEAISHIDLDDYYNKTEIDTTLLSYVKQIDLDATLQSYVTDDELQEAISHIDLDDYYNKTEIDTTLLSYVQNTQLDSTLTSYTTFDDIVAMTYTTKDYVDTAIATIPQPDLSDYYNKQDIDNTLTSYLKQDDLDTTLESYAKYSDLTSYIKQEDLDNVLTSYVLHDELDNYNEAIATALTYNKVDLLNTYTYFNNYYTKTEGDARYVTSSQVENNYVDFSSLDNVTYTTAAGLCDIDDRVSYIEDNVWTHSGGGGPLPSNVVTCEDASYIWMLTQSEYDDLETNQQLDNDTFYYISDATSNYVTSSDMNTAISTAIAGVTIDETNIVHLTGTETISGNKTFSGQCTWTNESKFGHSNIPNNDTLMSTDIASGINKSGMFVRPSMLQMFVGQILAPNTNYTNAESGQFSNEANVIKFQKVDSISSQQPSTLTTLAKIDASGIYEGTTLLANKYVQSSTIRNIVQISQNDYNNLSTPDANTLYIIT